MHEITLNGYYTLIAATLVLLVGKFMVRKIKFLRDFSIPEPVAGGLLAAAAVLVLHNFYGIVFNFETSLQDAFMLVFFSSIGLSADFSRLKQGGLPLVIFWWRSARLLCCRTWWAWAWPMRSVRIR